jgi:hypothetical protein
MLVAGCKSNPPQVAGKWHGANQLNATYSTTLSPKPKTQTAPADITLVLTQNGGAIQGEAFVILFKNSRYHLPLKAGVISQDGKVSLEGDSDSIPAASTILKPLQTNDILIQTKTGPVFYTRFVRRSIRTSQNPVF